MTVDQQLIEMRHLLRKHTLKSKTHGAAMTVRCMECGKNGASVPADIKHLQACRYGTLLSALGETVKWEQAMNVRTVSAAPLEECDT